MLNSYVKCEWDKRCRREGLFTATLTDKATGRILLNGYFCFEHMGQLRLVRAIATEQANN